MTSKDPTGGVVVLSGGEHLVHDESIPAELIGHPVHDWKSKAVEQFGLAQRRRKIIRKLVVQRDAARRYAHTTTLALNELRATDWRGFR